MTTCKQKNMTLDEFNAATRHHASPQTGREYYTVIVTHHDCPDPHQHIFKGGNNMGIRKLMEHDGWRIIEPDALHLRKFRYSSRQRQHNFGRDKFYYTAYCPRCRRRTRLQWRGGGLACCDDVYPWGTESWPEPCDCNKCKKAMGAGDVTSTDKKALTLGLGTLLYMADQPPKGDHDGDDFYLGMDTITPEQAKALTDYIGELEKMTGRKAS